ncbi:hypothetical protein D3C74_155700 [compost metagenome]
MTYRHTVARRDVWSAGSAVIIYQKELLIGELLLIYDLYAECICNRCIIHLSSICIPKAPKAPKELRVAHDSNY